MRRFDPKGNSTFNFGNDLEQQERKEAFKKFMECQAGPNPLLTEEKKRLSAEYVTLRINAQTVTSKLMGSGESEKKSIPKRCVVRTINESRHVWTVSKLTFLL